jgi:hypothetical protein
MSDPAPVPSPATPVINKDEARVRGAIAALKDTHARGMITTRIYTEKLHKLLTKLQTVKTPGSKPQPQPDL